MTPRIASALLLILFSSFAGCASTQVNSDTSSNANEMLRMEQLRRQLEEEERKRAQTMAEAMRTRQEAERQREAERQAALKAEQVREQKRLEEQRRENDARAEEERRKALQNQQADAKKLEADRLEQERRREEEKKAEELRRLEEERRRVAEEKRKARENLLNRTDPDRMSFFRREMEEELEDLDCSGNRGTVHIYRNKRPLQFFGSGRDVESADVDRPVTAHRLARAIFEKGDYVPLLGERNYRLLECKADSLVLKLLNIKADGQGNFWLLLEDQKGFLYTALREDLDLRPEAN